MVLDLLSDKLIFYITNFKKRLETILEAKSEVLQKISSLRNEKHKKTLTQNVSLVKFKLN
ncbi:hypothetical protein DAD63_03350 [Streptococcus agalactiae]|uniref:hypothetical protein n=1 Tax=Streptococcus agalactiae TaxID=1311 RepID=UPI00046CFB5B|nr:hypothetical protein [Streptococcus agalactiae]AQY25286.1 hypothetical protein B1H24_11155 [Streptococcus agalactiae]ASA80705.1 hypothetical protein BB161_11240 [Streptococcus agalactiae]ASA82775.1 hypothetical protein BB197_10695 [Streptococcus agalactiae]ASA84829.1 hypothetical protein BB194_10695 [Streptococcus agalactiae]ASA86875.1 hypothetical protein BB313_10690 [Streptococcus agalactiae]